MSTTQRWQGSGPGWRHEVVGHAPCWRRVTWERGGGSWRRGIRVRGSGDLIGCELSRREVAGLVGGELCGREVAGRVGCK